MKTPSRTLAGDRQTPECFVFNIPFFKKALSTPLLFHRASFIYSREAGGKALFVMGFKRSKKEKRAAASGNIPGINQTGLH